MGQGKNIKDYLHLYYGCMVARWDANGERFKDVINHAWLLEAFEKLDKPNTDAKHFFSYKPILRPLSDATEDEAYDLEMLGHELTIKQLDSIEFDSEVTRYMLSKGFDLFGLIESGLAIDKPH